MGADRIVIAEASEERPQPAVNLREVLNAIRYMARSGGGWRMRPRDFPPWQASIGGSAGLCAFFCSALSMTWR
jgi:transposase